MSINPEYHTLGKFTDDCAAIGRQIDARSEELRAAYQRIAELETVMKHAQEALFWYEGDGFEMDGRTIGQAIAEALS
jgi:hypothetical protein